MKTQTTVIRRYHRLAMPSLARWVALGLALLALGYLVDGSTESGHHACLILGGAVIGAGFTQAKRKAKSNE